MLVALHGFLGNVDRFHVLRPYLERHFKVYYFDLPFHGATRWEADRVLPEDLVGIIDWVQDQEPGAALELMGYSLGAKVSINLYLARPDAVSRLWLLAPDGMKTKYLHWAEKLPGFVVNKVSRMSEDPAQLRQWAAGLRQRGILPPQAHQFVEWNLATPERRRRAVVMWHTLQDFAIRPAGFRRTLLRRQTPVVLVLGQDDPYIPYAVWTDFADTVPTVHTITRRTGHRLLDRRTGELLEAILQNDEADSSGELSAS